jgi:uncharacterized membrane protein YsdA (DUF1294 family)
VMGDVTVTVWYDVYVYVVVAVDREHGAAQRHDWRIIKEDPETRRRRHHPLNSRTCC